MVTDDGSVGEKALVSKPIDEYLKNQGLDLILACGPIPMLKAVAAISVAQDIPAQLMLEQRMARGRGLLSCASVRADT